MCGGGGSSGGGGNDYGFEDDRAAVGERAARERGAQRAADKEGRERSRDLALSGPMGGVWGTGAAPNAKSAPAAASLSGGLYGDRNRSFGERVADWAGWKTTHAVDPQVPGRYNKRQDFDWTDSGLVGLGLGMVPGAGQALSGLYSAQRMARKGIPGLGVGGLLGDLSPSDTPGPSYEAGSEGNPYPYNGQNNNQTTAQPATEEAEGEKEANPFLRGRRFAPGDIDYRVYGMGRGARFFETFPYEQ